MKASTLSLLAAGVLFVCTGCVTQYRTMSLHEVSVVEGQGGRQVVLGTVNYLAYREVIERSPNVKAVTRMTDLRGDREPGEFAIAPDGKSLVYQAFELDAQPPYYNLWRISTTGAITATQVTAGRYYDIDPTFDPDGKNIYFSSNRSSPLPSIWRVRSDGAGGIARVTGGGSVDLMPCVDPAGKQVYYDSTPFNASLPQIWRIGTNGSLPTQMREGWRPRVSPDGKLILYTSTDAKTGRAHIWVMNEDGTNQTQLTDSTNSDELQPSWSPDGTRIIYASNEGIDSNGVRNFDIWVMGADGTNPTQLTTNGSTDIRPAIAPDGKTVYFLSNRGFFWDIWRMEMIEPSP